MTAFSSAGFRLLFEKFPKTTGLARNIAGIDRDLLRAEYGNLVKRAPRRARRGLPYFMANHDGTHSTSGRSSRNEEHIAVALWNLGGSWLRSDGGSFRFLDYQFPLFATDFDDEFRAVDLVAVAGGRQFVVVELKVPSKDENKRSDTPLNALMQGIRYAAVVEANLADIAREANPRFGLEVAARRPVVQVLAPKAWWCGWFHLKSSTRRAAGDWEPALARFADDVRTRLELAIEFMALDDVTDFGPDPRRPRLSSAPAL